MSSNDVEGRINLNKGGLTLRSKTKELGVHIQQDPFMELITSGLKINIWPNFGRSPFLPMGEKRNFRSKENFTLGSESKVRKNEVVLQGHSTLCLRIMCVHDPF